MTWLLAIALAAAVAAPPPLDAVPKTRLDAALRCQLGAYALADGRFVTITGNAGQPRELRYTLSTGQFDRFAFRGASEGCIASTSLVHILGQCTVELRRS